MKKKECQHFWEEDEMFASGAIMMISGNPKSLSQETKVICKHCGEMDWIPKKRIGSLRDIVEDNL